MPQPRRMLVRGDLAVEVAEPVPPDATLPDGSPDPGRGRTHDEQGRPYRLVGVLVDPDALRDREGRPLEGAARTRARRAAVRDALAPPTCAPAAAGPVWEDL